MKDDDEEEENTFGVTRYPCMPSLVALQQMRNRLHLAFLGRKLMKWTMTATGREMRRIAGEIDAIYKGFDADLRNAYILLARSRYFHPSLNQMVLENIPNKAAVLVVPSAKAVSGVKLMNYSIIETSAQNYVHLGLEKGGQTILETKKAWLELLKRLILMLQLRTSFLTVEISNRAATKKYNVLSKMVVPRVKLSEKYIVSEMEEMEREDNFRLKRFKELKTKKNQTSKEQKCTCEKPLEVQSIVNPSCDDHTEPKDQECVCVHKEEEQIIQPVSKASSTLYKNVCTFDESVGDVLREVCSCPVIAEEDKQPVQIIKEATATPEKSCTCIDNSVDWNNLCKIIGTEKLKELKDIYTAKSRQSQNECPCEPIDSKSLTKTSEKSCMCMPKPVNLEDLCKKVDVEESQRIKEVYMQKAVNPDQSRYECSCEPIKDKSNLSAGKSNTKSVQVPSNTHKCLECQKIKSIESKPISVNINENKDKDKTTTVKPQQDKDIVGDSQELGITVTEFKEVVTIKRFKKEDGTIGEERQVITVKSEAKHPPNTDTQTCLSCKSLKQKNSSSTPTKVKITLPVEKKSSQTSNVSVKSCTTCKLKASGSNISVDSRVPFKEIECASKGAQTGDKSKGTCCKLNKEDKSTSVTSSMDGKSSPTCLKHSSSSNTNRAKSCCKIKIVSKPKEHQNKNDKLIADNCFELIKRLLLESNKSNASKPSVCSCQSKKEVNWSTSQTSQKTCDFTKSSQSLQSEKSSQRSSESFVSCKDSTFKKKESESSCKCKSETKKDTCPTCGIKVAPTELVNKPSKCSCGKPAKFESNPSISSYGSFHKSTGTETDCPKCVKAQCAAQNKAWQQAKPECSLCSKNSESFRSKSESSIQQTKCCIKPKIEPIQSKCLTCAQKNACSCNSAKQNSQCSQDSNKTSEHSKSSEQSVDCKICCKREKKEVQQKKCCVQPKIESKQSKCPICAQKNTCSCNSAKPNRQCSQDSKKSSEHSKSSEQFAECEICSEPKFKEVGTNTKRADRYDVRNIDMLKPTKQLTCNCSSASYVAVDKWCKPPPKSSSYHGRCFH